MQIVSGGAVVEFFFKISLKTDTTKCVPNIGFGLHNYALFLNTTAFEFSIFLEVSQEFTPNSQ